MMQVSIAVISGAKFAYPNGVKSKYENVTLHASPSGLAKLHTAPYGRISKTSVMSGSIKYNNLFFMILTSLIKQNLSSNCIISSSFKTTV